MRKVISAETEEEWKELKRVADMFEQEVILMTENHNKDITIELFKALDPLGVKIFVENVVMKIDGITCKSGATITDISNTGLFGVLSDGSAFFIPQFKLKVERTEK